MFHLYILAADGDAIHISDFTSRRELQSVTDILDDAGVVWSYTAW